MITHMPGFQSFFSFFASFHIAKISDQQQKGYGCFSLILLSLGHNKDLKPCNGL